MQEAAKLDYDTYKHMTTLSTGSLVLLVTFIDKVFDKPEWSILVVVSILCFMVSIVFSVVAMFGVSYSLHLEKLINDGVELPSAMILQKGYGWIIFFSCCGFLAGLFFLAVFSAKNLLIV